MKKIHVITYHSIYWIYRVINILTFNHYLFGVDWYRGAYVVQLVLMPFFYINYGWIIPSLINKNYKKFLGLTVLWVSAFVWVYSLWTSYQLNILYGQPVIPPNYIETINNLIYIWLISASFCLFEYWLKNLNKNQELALKRKKHDLKSEENKMLNQLLSEYLHAMDKYALEMLPDKIIMVSDFFKYVLYSRDKPIALKTEIRNVRIFEELINSNSTKVKIFYGYLEDEILIQPASIISVLNRLVEVLYDGIRPIEVTVAVGQDNEIQIYIANLSYDNLTRLTENGFTYRMEEKMLGGRVIIPLILISAKAPVLLAS